MVCRKCGKLNVRTLKFCVSCGTELALVEEKSFMQRYQMMLLTGAVVVAAVGYMVFF